MAKKVNNYKPPPDNIWSFFKAFSVAAVNKGQILVFCVFAIVLTMVIKMPPTDIRLLSSDIVNKLVDFTLMGWGLMGITLFAWNRHVRYLSRVRDREIDRISKEKTELQNLLAQRALRSSNKKDK